MPENKPYKGHESYQVEDSGIFFGRGREAEQLTAKILASPFTVVHARSGAGKTSILNARVIPALEERGWTVTLARPHFDPVQSLRASALEQILPPPAAEAEALRRVKGILFPERDPALQELLDRFDSLEVRDDRRQQALEPLSPAATPETGAPPSGPGTGIRPLFFRLLRATLEVSQYGEHIATLIDPRGADRSGAFLDAKVSTLAFAELLGQPAVACGHRELLRVIEESGPGLEPFFVRLLETYGSGRTRFGLVLIIDQFEELFTRFTGEAASNDRLPHAQAQPGWELRIEFFNQLETLHAAALRLPIHLVISMRDEYIAQLDPLRRFVRELDGASYHLTYLEKEEARYAVREPARLFGFDYTEEVHRDILGALVREDRFVEPAQLQIVCEKLWENTGRELAQGSRTSDPGSREIGMNALPKGGARAILDNFFGEYLAELDRDDPTRSSRLESLEILDSLVVAETGTRNIVEKRVLVSAPFSDPERRAKLLEKLASKRIIRLEQRLGGEFAEVTHEFLIGPILQHVAAELNGNDEYSNFRWALRTLSRYKDTDFREGTGNLLPRPVFTILSRWRDRLCLGASTIERIFPELMLRSALNLGVDRETLAYWMQAFAESGEAPTITEILSPARLNDPGRQLMSLYELGVVREQKNGELTFDQAAFILRTQLARSRDEDREAIVFWAREVIKRAAEPAPDC